MCDKDLHSFLSQFNRKSANPSKDLRTLVRSFNNFDFNCKPLINTEGDTL